MADLPELPESIEVPPEVYKVILQIKQVVDAAVAQLQPLQLSAAGTMTVARPETVTAKVHIPLPAVKAEFNGRALPPVPTVPEVRMARAWVEAAKKGGLPAVMTLSVIADLLDLGERLIGLAP